MAKKPAPNPLLQLDNQLCFAVYSAGHAFNRVYKPLLERLKLTYPQYLAMLVLWEQDNVPVKDIGERLFLDSGTLTPLLKRLEAAGLIKRTRSIEDERQMLIALTAQGQALREKAKAVPQGILAAFSLSRSATRSFFIAAISPTVQADAARIPCGTALAFSRSA